MENRFPRITSDFKVNAGLPSIRDTGIAAFLIASKRIYGESTSAIREEFHMLELEDIEEAQAYIMHEMFGEAHYYVLFDLRTILNTIYGVADMLHFEDINLEPSERKQLIEMLFDSRSKASRVIDPVLGWRQVYVGNLLYRQKAFITNELFDGIEDAAKTEGIALELRPSDKTQSVVGMKELAQDGIRWVVIGSSWHPFQSRTTIEVIANQTTSVSVIIRCPLKSLEDNNSLSTHFFNPTSVGSMFLVRAGLKPSIQLSSTDMTYQFDLPMSKSDEANNV